MNVNPRILKRILFFGIMPIAILFVALQIGFRFFSPADPFDSNFLARPTEEQLLPPAPAPISDPARGITDFVPTVNETKSETSGFFHPGIGMRKRHWDTMQRRVRAGDQPWADAYELFRKNPDAKRDLDFQELLPLETNSSPLRLWRAADAAYRQIVMWFISGDEQFRSNALQLVRAWKDGTIFHDESSDFLFCSDAAFKFCFVAELLKRTEGKTDATRWTEEDDDAFLQFLCAMRPSFDHFDRTPHEHALGANAALAAAIFTDDKELFATAAERFLVNSNGSKDAANGALVRQFPIVQTNALSEEPLAQPHLQVASMADEPDDPTRLIEAYSAAAAMIAAQEVFFDDKTGLISKKYGASSVFDFADERLLSGAKIWADYHSGKSVPYTPSVRNERTKEMSLWIANEEMRGAPAPAFGILCNNLLLSDDYKFKQNRCMSLIRMYESCLPEPDSPFGFGSATLLFTPNKFTQDPFIKRFSLTEELGSNRQPRRSLAGMNLLAGSARLMQDSPDQPWFVRVFSAMETTVMAFRGHGFPKSKDEIVSLRLRSNGEATLYLENKLLTDRKKRRRIRIPDTNEKWTWFDFELHSDNPVNDLAFYSVFGSFSKCDLAEIDLAPDDPLKIEKITMTPRHHAQKAPNGDRIIYLFPDVPYVLRFFTNRPIQTANVHGLLQKIESCGFQQFDFNPETLELKITPSQENVNQTHVVQINLYDGKGRATTQLFFIQIVKDPRALAYAVAGNWTQTTEYEPETRRNFIDAYSRLLKTDPRSPDVGRHAFMLAEADGELVPNRLFGTPLSTYLGFELDDADQYGASLYSVRDQLITDWPLVPGVRNKGRALRNDGSLYLSLPSVDMHGPASGVTVSCFLKAPKKFLRERQPLFSTQDDLGSPGWRIESDPDNALILIADDDPKRTIRVPIERKRFFQPDVWMHLLFVVDPTKGTFRVWRNTREVETKSDALIGAFKKGSVFLYGARTLSSPYDPNQFDLDELKIWQAIPTEEELKDIQAIVKEKTEKEEKIKFEEGDMQTDAPLLVPEDELTEPSPLPDDSDESTGDGASLFTDSQEEDPAPDDAEKIQPPAPTQAE